jgi:hypothetical protein
MPLPLDFLKRLLRQPPHIWADLAYAQAMLLAAQMTVWWRPVGELMTEAGGEEPGTAAVVVKHAPDRKAMRYANAVRFASIHGLFRPKCLVRAVAIDAMVRRAGIPGSRIRIGVQVQEGRFSAHAWVELNGRVLGDRRDHVRRFAQIADIRVVQPFR